VSVTGAQRKLEVKGGNLPSGSSRKRSRGCRGRRVGVARGRQPRCLPSGALHPADANCLNPVREKGTHDSYVSRVRRRRMTWIESRFKVLESLKKNDRVVGHVYLGGMKCEVKASHVLQDSISQAFARKKLPRPPGKVQHWYSRWLRLKYGTWGDVSDELVDGEWDFPTPETPDLTVRIRVTRHAVHITRDGPGRIWRGACRHCGFFGILGPGFHLAPESCNSIRERRHPLRLRRRGTSNTQPT